MITVIPPEVTQTLSEQTRFYEIPEKYMHRVFGESMEQWGKTLEQMRRQSGCESAEFGNPVTDQSSEKYGRPLKCHGTPKQIKAMGDCLEMGLVAANKEFKVKTWQKMQNQIHLERWEFLSFCSGEEVLMEWKLGGSFDGTGERFTF